MNREGSVGNSRIVDSERGGKGRGKERGEEGRGGEGKRGGGRGGGGEEGRGIYVTYPLVWHWR